MKLLNIYFLVNYKCKFNYSTRESTYVPGLYPPLSMVEHGAAQSSHEMKNGVTLTAMDSTSANTCMDHSLVPYIFVVSACHGCTVYKQQQCVS